MSNDEKKLLNVQPAQVSYIPLKKNKISKSLKTLSCFQLRPDFKGSVVGIQFNSLQRFFMALPCVTL